MESMFFIYNADKAHEYYREIDNYYSCDAGEWWGKGAEAMGLDGAVNLDDFKNLLKGNAPDGTRIIAPGGKDQIHRLGFDRTLSAPKSFSIAALVLDDARLIDIHRAACTDVLEYTQQNLVYARKTVKGVTRHEQTDNLIAAMFPHDLSREGDPQIHTHMVHINATLRSDEKWRAISNEMLVQDRRLLGHIYQNSLAKRARALGYQIKANQETGLFELKGISDDVLKHFSKRSAQVTKRFAELKAQFPDREDYELREQAIKETRKSKQGINKDQIKHEWIQDLKTFGYTVEKLKHNMLNQKELQLQSINHVDQALAILTDKESLVKRKDIIQTALMLSVGQKDLADIERDFETSKTLMLIDRKKGLYTSTEIREIEISVYKKISNPANKSDKQLIANFDRKDWKEMSGLFADQKKAFRHICTTTDRFTGIQGDAGTGKTYMLGRVAQLLKKKGIEVVGVGVTTKAVAALQNNGISSKTLDRFLLETEKKSKGAVDLLGLSKQKIYMLDEASMLGSEKMNRFLDQINKKDMVIMAGDIKQFQSIQAGGIFQKLQEKKALTVVRLKQTTRFKTELTQMVSSHLAELDAGSAIMVLRVTDRLHQVKDNESRMEKAANHYTKLKERNQSILLVSTNEEREKLNTIIQDKLKASGQINKKSYEFDILENKRLDGLGQIEPVNYECGDTVVISERFQGLNPGKSGQIISTTKAGSILIEDKNQKLFKIDIKTHGQFLNAYKPTKKAFAKGEKIICTKPDNKLDIPNGLTGTIERINRNGDIVAKAENGRDYRFNVRDYPHIDHGYSMTNFKSQSMTVDTVIAVMNSKSHMNRNAFTVIGTRAQNDIHIYTDDIERLTQKISLGQEKTSNLDYYIDEQSAKTKSLFAQMKSQNFGLEM